MNKDDDVDDGMLLNLPLFDRSLFPLGGCVRSGRYEEEEDDI